MLELWKYLEPVVEEFHGDVDKNYMNFYDLLHENMEILLLPISCYLKLFSK